MLLLLLLTVDGTAKGEAAAGLVVGSLVSSMVLFR